MSPHSVRQSAEEFLLKESISRKHQVEIDSIILFQEFGEFMTALFGVAENPHTQIVAAAPAIAELALAADKAELELVETVSVEPFAAEIESLKRKIRSHSDFVYLANPNRLTGATLSLSQIKKLAALVNDGMIIIDEHFYQFSQLSAITLTKEFDNVVIIRTIQDWESNIASECGYAILSEKLQNKFSSVTAGSQMERAKAQWCHKIFDDADLSNDLVKQIQKRTLETALELMECGVKSQITPTDSILLSFSNRDQIQKLLADNDIRTESIGESPVLSNYLRYRITCAQKDKELAGLLSRHANLLKNTLSETGADKLELVSD